MLPNTESVSAHTSVACSFAWEEFQQRLGFCLIMGTRATGDLHLVSVPKSTGIHLHVQRFPLCMGIALHQNQLYVGCQFDVREYTDALVQKGVSSPIFERCYVPRKVSFTGDLDVHEMDIRADGSLVFVNTKYSCLATLSNTHSFKVFWKPEFINTLKPEDRCHLNGLCMENGQVRYVTMFAQSNRPEGWRQLPFESGCVLDVRTGDVVCSGLVQPHSPRLYRNELYVLNSGAGEFGRIDRKTGRFDCIAYVGGYGRGLTFVGDYAIFGLSRPRRDEYISGLLLHERLKAANSQDRCVLLAVNINTGEVIDGVEFQGGVRELFDVKAIENCRSISMMDMNQAQHPALVTVEYQAEIDKESVLPAPIGEFAAVDLSGNLLN